jgi:TonB family protein
VPGQRSPRRGAPPVEDAPADAAVAVAQADPAAEATAGAPAPTPEELLPADEAAEELVLAAFDGPKPKPIGVERLELPRELRKKKASGRIVLLVRLDAEGKVLDLAVDSSDLPDFEPFVVSEVRQWRFTPPTRQGEPVEAYARLPIPIHVN